MPDARQEPPHNRTLRTPLTIKASGEDCWANIVDRDGQVVGKWRDPDITGADDREFLRRVNRADR